MTKRATFATRLGVIAATAGSSVGLGNIWRFPYETGQNGGAAFLLVYCICVIVLGLPVMLAEFTIGRSAKANATRTFMKLSPGSYWFIVGFLGIFAAVFIMGFYSVIAGWTLEYVWQSISFGLTGKDPAFFQSAFVEFTSSSFRPIFWTALFLLINYIILSRGVHNGIEKASNILMPLLFVLLIIFGIRSLFLSGTAEGLSFMFHPDFSKIDSGVVLRAMGQAFFSLSLGMGTLITYSSYFSENTSLPKTAVTVASLDTVSLYSRLFFLLVSVLLKGPNLYLLLYLMFSSTCRELISGRYYFLFSLRLRLLLLRSRFVKSLLLFYVKSSALSEAELPSYWFLYVL